jgi:flagellar hook-associated protein 2
VPWAACSASCARLSDIGLELQRDGTLSVDSAKLDTATGNLPELKKAFANSDAGNSANDGFARRYAALATQVLGVDGSLTTRTEGLRERLARNSTDQERLSDRIERYQARLVAQYTAMDANLSKLNSLSSYLTQQLASLTSSNNNDE